MLDINARTHAGDDRPRQGGVVCMSWCLKVFVFGRERCNQAPYGKIMGACCRKEKKNKKIQDVPFSASLLLHLQAAHIHTLIRGH
jgi:hypothetical protein